MNNPDISIVMACYNCDSTVERAIESALAQRNVTIELLCIDDCSTDQTLTLLQKHTDPRMRVFQTSHNAGPSAARNIGVQKAQGDWIAILDSDDALDPTYLSDMLQSTQDRDPDIIVGNLTSLNSETHKTKPFFDDRLLLENQEISLFDLISSPDFGYLKPLFSRAFLQKYDLTYDEHIKLGEDYLLLRNALHKQAKCVIGPPGGYIYTRHNNSLSYRSTPEDIQKLLQKEEDFFNHITDIPLHIQRKRISALKAALNVEYIARALKAKKFVTAFLIAMKSPVSVLKLWIILQSKLKHAWTTQR